MQLKAPITITKVTLYCKHKGPSFPEKIILLKISASPIRMNSLAQVWFDWNRTWNLVSRTSLTYLNSKFYVISVNFFIIGCESL